MVDVTKSLHTPERHRWRSSMKTRFRFAMCDIMTGDMLQAFCCEDGIVYMHDQGWLVDYQHPMG